MIEPKGKRGGIVTCEVCNDTFEVKDRYSVPRNPVGGQCTRCKSLPNTPVTQTMLNEVFNYDELSGELTYKRNFRARAKGGDPTTIGNHGYRFVTLNNKTYLAHRIIWFMQTGVMPDYIDHDDRDPLNNAWSNLNNMTNQQNNRNKGTNKNNSSGQMGVSRHQKTRWRAYINIDYKQKHIGVYDDYDEAVKARKQAEVDYGFHTNHGDK